MTVLYVQCEHSFSGASPFPDFLRNTTRVPQQSDADMALAVASRSLTAQGAATPQLACAVLTLAADCGPRSEAYHDLQQQRFKTVYNGRLREVGGYPVRAMYRRAIMRGVMNWDARTQQPVMPRVHMQGFNSPALGAHVGGARRSSREGGGNRAKGQLYRGDIEKLRAQRIVMREIN